MWKAINKRKYNKSVRTGIEWSLNGAFGTLPRKLRVRTGWRAVQTVFPCLASLRGCHHPLRCLHTYITPVCLHELWGYVIHIILPWLKRIRPQICILFWWVLYKWNKVFDIKDIRHLNMAWELQPVCVRIDLVVPKIVLTNCTSCL